MASARDIVSSIISAANKKIQRRRKTQDEIDNSEHDNDKVGTNCNFFVDQHINLTFNKLGQVEARIGEFADDSTEHGFKRTTVFSQRDRADA